MSATSRGFTLTRDTAMQLWRDAFDQPRTKRSAPYREGAKYALLTRAEVFCFGGDYKPGTPEFDAFHAGAMEGHAIARAFKAGRLRASSPGRQDTEGASDER